MVDVFDKAKRSAVMSCIKAQDTKPEMAVRRIAFALGYRYRLHRKDLPGKPDLVFPRLHKVIFVHGCFWHQHNCKEGRNPSSNREYWVPKLIRNKERDKSNLKALKELRWKCLIVWECELTNPDKTASRIYKFLSSPD